MATVFDVARLAGVSTATVSRVLSGQGRVNEEMCRRVHAAVKKTGFVPNPAAQALRRGHASTVALLVGDIEQTLYSVLTRHVQSVLGEIGLDVLVYNLGHSEERLWRMLERADALRMRGVVIASTDAMDGRKLGTEARKLARSGIAMVSLGQQLGQHGILSIVHEEQEAARLGVRHLLAERRMPVAYLGRIEGSMIGSDRFQGYCRALADAGIALDRKLVWDAAYRYEAGRDAVGRAIRHGMMFRGIQAGSDELALGAMAALADAGLAIPNEVALIGFGNIDWGAHLRPALTTLSVHPDTVAARLRDVFVALDQNRPAPEFRPIPRSLVRRESA